MDLHLLKKQVHEIGSSLIQSKIDELNTELANFQAAANNESKSSAGDKYETGRAMMHLEKEKVSALLNQVLKQQKVLREMRVDKKVNKGALGGLVSTDGGAFYLSVSLGKVKVGDEEIICISPVSPLGNAMLGKALGGEVTFNKRTYKILEVV